MRTLQCNRKDTCAICLHGYLPEWSSRDNRPEGFGMGFGRLRYCGYRGCGQLAIAKVPRIKAVCAEHAYRSKVTKGKGLLEYALERVAKLFEQDAVRNLRWYNDNWVRWTRRAA